MILVQMSTETKSCLHRIQNILRSCLNVFCSAQIYLTCLLEERCNVNFVMRKFFSFVTRRQPNCKIFPKRLHLKQAQCIKIELIISEHLKGTSSRECSLRRRDYLKILIYNRFRSIEDDIVLYYLLLVINSSEKTIIVVIICQFLNHLQLQKVFSSLAFKYFKMITVNVLNVQGVDRHQHLEIETIIVIDFFCGTFITHLIFLCVLDNRFSFVGLYVVKGSEI